MPALPLRRPRWRFRCGLLACWLALCGAACSPEAPPRPDACPVLTYAWNGELTESLRTALDEVGVWPLVAAHRLAFVLVDVTDLRRPRLAAVNPQWMVYGPHVPKLGELFAAFVLIDRGALTLDDATRDVMRRIARTASNVDAAWLFHRLNEWEMNTILASEPYRLFHPDLGGGLWAGRSSHDPAAPPPHPIVDVYHGTNALQVARFYDLIACGAFSTGLTREIADLFAIPWLAAGPSGDGIRDATPDAAETHVLTAGAGIVERSGDRYIVVGLAERPLPDDWLLEVVGITDDLMDSFETASVSRPASKF